LQLFVKPISHLYLFLSAAKMVQNKGLIFKKIPTGWPKDGEHLKIEDRPVDLESTLPPENGLLT
jgi:hypothetical protein